MTIGFVGWLPTPVLGVVIVPPIEPEPEPEPAPTPPPVIATPSEQDAYGSWKWAKGVCPQAAMLQPQSHTMSSESIITRKRRYVRFVGGDRWVCDLEIRNTRKLVQRVEALLARLKGPSGKVALWDFVHPRPLGPCLDETSLPRTRYLDGTQFSDGTRWAGGDGTLKVYGNWPIGVEEVLIYGVPADSVQLVGGDQIGLNGRLYRLARDLESNGLGIARAYLHRGLLTVVAHDTDVVTDKPTSPFNLVDDDQAVRTRTALTVASLTLRFVEAL